VVVFQRSQWSNMMTAIFNLALILTLIFGTIGAVLVQGERSITTGCQVTK